MRHRFEALDQQFLNFLANFSPFHFLLIFQYELKKIIIVKD
jgi:hypothetical protein